MNGLYRLKFAYAFLLFIFCFGIADAQHKCGYNALRTEIEKRGYTIQQDTGITTTTAHKTTAATSYTIPVVFHVILTQVQLNQLGGSVGLQRFIDSQMVVINQDFNARNADTATIPAPFKSLIGNATVQFALARTTPAGTATEGYELQITTKQGFELNGTAGSGLAFSDAKYKSHGGLDAWDPSTYLNFWITNLQEGGGATTILGLTLPPSLISYYNIPEAELGIIVSYKAWGSINNFRGRTMTHELGHFFELLHMWGNDDEGDCPKNGEGDDGIGDTPPQSTYTYGCPNFPRFDKCTNSFPGIMFMNYMDYTDDNCQRMFTKGQVDRMHAELDIFGSSFRLTRHPEVLNYPSQSQQVYTIYPNPSSGKINIGFNHTPSGLEYIHIIDAFGRSIQRMNITEQRGFYTFDLNIVSSGMYFMQLKFTDKVITEKIILAHD